MKLIPKIIHGDCTLLLPKVSTRSVDCCITSPPYNLNKDYGTYKDNLPRNDYLCWMAKILAEIARVLKSDGHFFFNIAGAASDPELPLELIRLATQQFTIQNHIIWVKSIAVDGAAKGHCKPLQSRRFLNRQWENIYHLTHEGNVPVNRLAIGVPYADKSNLTRGSRGKNGDVRCAGDVWFIPYPTVQNRKTHPAAFPEELATRCLKLAGLPQEAWVLDPFAGSGTVGASARRLGLNSLLFELNPKYVEMARSWIDTIKDIHV
jgi:site-specific DNA-methyltransferase (adenine-specific)